MPAIVLTLEATYWFSTELALPGEKMFRMNEYMYGIFFAAVPSTFSFGGGGMRIRCLN